MRCLKWGKSPQYLAILELLSELPPSLSDSTSSALPLRACGHLQVKYDAYTLKGGSLLGQLETIRVPVCDLEEPSITSLPPLQLGMTR